MEKKPVKTPGSQESCLPGLTDVTVTTGSQDSSGYDADNEAVPERSRDMADTISGLTAGKTIIKERFVLDELLGSGGMGTVYKAIDLRKVEAHDRDPFVAVKLLNDDFKKHAAALISLQREARKSQLLTHPNIIKVFDFDRDADRVYMTMEMLSGRSLRQYMRESPLSLDWDKALDICRQMGEALQHAHDNGIIHADFSPKNVILTEKCEVKVLDFGIAQAMAVADGESLDGENTRFDLASLGGLTPGYASFEQLTGKSPVPADDVFALGCVIYQLLSGKHPHDEKTALDALSAKIRPKKIDKLSGKQWRALQKAMALQRVDRYDAVAEFLHDFFPGKNPAVKPFAIAAGVVVVIVMVAAYQAYLDSAEKQANALELTKQREALASTKAEMEKQQALELERTARELEQINKQYLTLAEQLIAGDHHDEAQEYIDRVSDTPTLLRELSAVQAKLTESRAAYQLRMESQENLRAELNSLLDKVQIDIAAGKLVRPPGDSAYSAYQQIVALEPDNLQARAVLQRLVQLHLDGSEQALRQEKLQEASVWLDDLAMIAPDNQNLSRLRSELKQAQVKVQRRDARIASLLDRARALEERDDAEQRRDLYLQVIEIDPRNSTARKGLARTEDVLKQSEIQQRKQAEDAAAARFRMAKQLLDEQPPDPGNFELAQRYLLEAQSLSPGFAPVTDLIREMPLRYIRVIRNSISAEEYKQAEAFIRPAMTLSPQDSTLLGLQKELTDLVREQEQLMLPASF